MLGINSVYYQNVLNYKKAISNDFEMFLSGDDNTLIVTADELIALFLLDENNLNLPLFNLMDYKNIRIFIESYRRNPEKEIYMSKPEALSLYKFSKLKRLTGEKNREIALLLAKKYNHSCRKIEDVMNIDVFNKVCDNIV